MPYDQDATIFYYTECIDSSNAPSLTELAKNDLAYFLGGIIDPSSQNQRDIDFANTLTTILSDSTYQQGFSRFKVNQKQDFSRFKVNQEQALQESFLFRILKELSNLTDKTPVSPYNKGALVLYRRNDFVRRDILMPAERLVGAKALSIKY
jgi:hypothetical protein